MLQPYTEVLDLFSSSDHFQELLNRPLTISESWWKQYKTMLKLISMNKQTSRKAVRDDGIPPEFFNCGGAELRINLHEPILRR